MSFLFRVSFLCSYAILFTQPLNNGCTMRIDKMIQALLPHDEKFFVLFDKLSNTIVEAADILRTLPSLAKFEK